MKRAALLRAEHYRDMARRFRLLADVEPLHSLRRHLRRVAAQHDVMASELEAALCVDAGAEKDLATEPQRDRVR